MKKTLFFALCTAAFAGDAPIKDVDCNKVVKALQMAIDADESKTLELVAAQVAATPECASQIVRTAIVAGGPNITSAQVLAIVTAATTAAPQFAPAIVTAAINASGASAGLTGAIAGAAASAAPGQASAIGIAAVQAGPPGSAATVQEGLAGRGRGVGNPLNNPGGRPPGTPPPNFTPRTSDTDP